PRASRAARRALELWRTLQRPHRAVFAAMIWTRAVGTPGAELDQACAELDALVAQTPDLPTHQRMVVHGALAVAGRVRGDHAAVLTNRLAELALAQEGRMLEMIDAAESSVVDAFNQVERYAEAAERGRSLLARLEREGNTSASLPWAFISLLEA